ncbi:MAG: hypothetical protein MZV63_27160 [Marinilabiliales bacterium]|nr:hypothetical protein [Marinilabiliales bacterium]
MLARAQEDTLTFRDVDHHSLELYQQGDWKGLIRYNNEAFSQGIDYYFLRLRTGIAYFETKKYMKAALHLKKPWNSMKGMSLQVNIFMVVMSSLIKQKKLTKFMKIFRHQAVNS